MVVQFDGQEERTSLFARVAPRSTRSRRPPRSGPSREQPRASRNGRAPARPKKSVEELDAEMEDYWKSA